MADETKTKIVIPRNGIMSGQQQVRGLDTRITNKVVDALGGEKTITRASHVEPGSGLSEDALQWLHDHYSEPGESPYLTPKPLRIAAHYANKWFADLLPVDGPVLGPFPDRQEALRAEEHWLHEHHIPVYDTCRDPLREAGATPTPTRLVPLVDPATKLPTGQMMPIKAGSSLDKLIQECTTASAGMLSPTGRWSNDAPPASDHGVAMAAMVCSPEERVKVDFARVEQVILQRYRQAIAATVVRGTFNLEDDYMPVFDIDENDTYQAVVQPSPGIYYIVTLTFVAGTTALANRSYGRL